MIERCGGLRFAPETGKRVTRVGVIPEEPFDCDESTGEGRWLSLLLPRIGDETDRGDRGRGDVRRDDASGRELRPTDSENADSVS